MYKYVVVPLPNRTYRALLVLAFYALDAVRVPDVLSRRLYHKVGIDLETVVAVKVIEQVRM